MRIFLTFILLFSQTTYSNTLIDKIYNFFSPTYQEKNVSTNIFPSAQPPEQENIFIFSPKEHTWAVYNKHGKRVGLGMATGGKDYCPDIKAKCRTVEGKFRVFRKEDQTCTSNTFPIDEGGGAPMPYCIFFHKGYAIHGSDHVANNNMSHGCVRVSRKAAEWINKNYIHEGSYVLILPYE